MSKLTTNRGLRQLGYRIIKLTTNHGVITLQLDTEKAPVTTANFIQYVEEGFYDGTIFHRVIPGFMIQGGGFDAKMKQKGTRKAIQNEADNGAKNKRGSIAMARTNEPDSATAQFFINVADNAFLDFKEKTQSGWGYCVFGEVLEGMDVVDKIAAVETGSSSFHQNVPLETVVIEKAEIVADQD